MIGHTYITHTMHISYTHNNAQMNLCIIGHTHLQYMTWFHYMKCAFYVYVMSYDICHATTLWCVIWHDVSYDTSQCHMTYCHDTSCHMTHHNVIWQYVIWHDIHIECTFHIMKSWCVIWHNVSYDSHVIWHDVHSMT